MRLFTTVTLTRSHPITLLCYGFRLVAAVIFIVLCSDKSVLAAEVVYCSDIWDDYSDSSYGNVIACGITDVSYSYWKYHDASVEIWLRSPSGVTVFDTAGGEPYDTYQMLTVSLPANFDSPKTGFYSEEAYHFSVCPSVSWGNTTQYYKLGVSTACYKFGHPDPSAPLCIYYPIDACNVVCKRDQITLDPHPTDGCPKYAWERIYWKQKEGERAVCKWPQPNAARFTPLPCTCFDMNSPF
jgi:hypothetical protein